MPKPDTTEVIAFVDGACLGNPGAGGWAVILVGRKRRIVKGGKRHTTNQRMELLAAIRAVELSDPDLPLKIYSDSQYVVRGATDWMKTWKRSDWCGSRGKEIANVLLWMRLDRALSERTAIVRFEWVRGHAASRMNNKADAIAAGEARKRLLIVTD